MQTILLAGSKRYQPVSIVFLQDAALQTIIFAGRSLADDHTISYHLLQLFGPEVILEQGFVLLGEARLRPAIAMLAMIVKARLHYIHTRCLTGVDAATLTTLISDTVQMLRSKLHGYSLGMAEAAELMGVLAET